MTIEQRLTDLEAFKKDVDSWHVPGKLNKLGDSQAAVEKATDLHHAEIAALQQRNAALEARIAALEARLGPPAGVAG